MQKEVTVMTVYHFSERVNTAVSIAEVEYVKVTSTCTRPEVSEQSISRSIA